MRTGGSVAKNPPANARDERDVGSIPGSGRSPGKGNGSPLQYFCLENPMDNRAWQAIVHGIQRVRHDWESKQQQNQWELVFIGKFWTTYSKWSEFRFGSESVGNEEQPPVLAWVKEYVTRVDALTCHVDPPSAKKDLLPQTAESSDFRQNSTPPWSWELLVLKGNVLSRPDVLPDTTCLQLLVCLWCHTKAWSQLHWVWPRPHAWVNFCSFQSCFFSFLSQEHSLIKL